MLTAQYTYKDVEGEIPLNLSDFHVDKPQHIPAENLIEYVASEIEGKPIKIDVENYKSGNNGKRNVLEDERLAQKYHFSRLVLVNDGIGLLYIV